MWVYNQRFFLRGQGPDFQKYSHTDLNKQLDLQRAQLWFRHINEVDRLKQNKAKLTLTQQQLPMSTSSWERQLREKRGPLGRALAMALGSELPSSVAPPSTASPHDAAGRGPPPPARLWVPRALQNPAMGTKLEEGITGKASENAVCYQGKTQRWWSGLRK